MKSMREPLKNQRKPKQNRHFYTKQKKTCAKQTFFNNPENQRDNLKIHGCPCFSEFPKRCHGVGLPRRHFGRSPKSFLDELFPDIQTMSQIAPLTLQGIWEVGFE